MATRARLPSIRRTLRKPDSVPATRADELLRGKQAGGWLVRLLNRAIRCSTGRAAWWSALLGHRRPGGMRRPGMPEPPPRSPRATVSNPLFAEDKTGAPSWRHPPGNVSKLRPVVGLILGTSYAERAVLSGATAGRAAAVGDGHSARVHHRRAWGADAESTRRDHYLPASRGGSSRRNGRICRPRCRRPISRRCGRCRSSRVRRQSRGRYKGPPLVSSAGRDASIHLGFSD